ncbi:4Fe-4S dicluster domain-containing protein [Desulfosarcina ovata]|uniref:(Fe-S)-binding protein n=1 Tax=Desulfosarcina ovata subsp. ovata TaxID=2752305 RepID=A0A5K8ACH5_9BACT|nr:4Fe-4S dicluster domain-containing protein [Desulfosarcina ovata]BBO90216.1 (Fe-S)-binding protein [Desulfosarcina ovata subsp. ovata]
MAHIVTQSAYDRLTDRLNRFPQGAPPSELLTRILAVLFNQRDAELVSLLPVKPFTVATAARVWHLPENETRRILDRLADKALLVDMEVNGAMNYVLPPPMAGFFEFAMMRVREDIDQPLLAELFYEYLNVEEDFVRTLFTEGETQLGRAFVDETVLSEANALFVLDWERASEVIRTASHRGVSTCYCRHKMLHLERGCDAPLDICMTFNTAAASLIRHGHARAVTVSECMERLAMAREHHLVQFGENVRQGVNFICNCCGCCCEAMLAARRFAIMHPVHTTGFLPRVNTDSCNGCGKCVERCPVAAMSLVSANDPHHPKRKVAQVDAGHCLGCGVCLSACTKTASLTLQRRPRRVLTPLNTIHRSVIMAVERGKLQHLLFDNRVLWHHRALAVVVGAILRLPPVKRALATDQVKSRYLEALALHYS